MHVPWHHLAIRMWHLLRPESVEWLNSYIYTYKPRFKLHHRPMTQQLIIGQWLINIYVMHHYQCGARSGAPLVLSNAMTSIRHAYGRT